jgi:hypothetical protein
MLKAWMKMADDLSRPTQNLWTFLIQEDNRDRNLVGKFRYNREVYSLLGLVFLTQVFEIEF